MDRWESSWSNVGHLPKPQQMRIQRPTRSNNNSSSYLQNALTQLESAKQSCSLFAVLLNQIVQLWNIRDRCSRMRDSLMTWSSTVRAAHPYQYLLIRTRQTDSKYRRDKIFETGHTWSPLRHQCL